MNTLHFYNKLLLRKNILFGQSYETNLKPRLLYFNAVTKNNERLRTEHLHDFTEIAFIVSGSGVATVGEDTRNVHTGDLIVFNPGVKHSISCSSDVSFEMHLLAFDQFEIRGLNPNTLLAPSYEFLYHTANMYNTFRVLFRQILFETNIKDAYFNEISQNTARIVFFYLLRMIDQCHVVAQKIEKNQILRCATLYINQNYLKEISLEDISKHCAVSKYYLSHLFSKYHECTVGEYILQKRMHEAKRLLNFTDLSISEIAEKAGFNDTSYFCRKFKSVAGITPREYRNTTRL